MGCALLIEQSNAFSGVAAEPVQLAPDACEGAMAIAGPPAGICTLSARPSAGKVNTLKPSTLAPNPLAEPRFPGTSRWAAAWAPGLPWAFRGPSGPAVGPPWASPGLAWACPRNPPQILVEIER